MSENQSSRPSISVVTLAVLAFYHPLVSAGWAPTVPLPLRALDMSNHAKNAATVSKPVVQPQALSARP